MDSTIGTALTGLFGMVIALAIVLGLAWLSLRLLKQWQDRGFERRGEGPDRDIRFIRALPVGQRERLLLIEAQGELMLVGVSAGSISLLRNWGSDADGGVDGNGAAAAAAFAAIKDGRA